ncbi:FG-GAP repeat domain-containing protein [Streptomyces nogalater]
MRGLAGSAAAAPDGPSAVAACLTGSGDLIADVDDDGRPDRITDPSHHGAGLAIAFGTGSRRERTVPARGLADRPGNRQRYVRAAVADFDQDGWSDLAVVAGRAQGGDDPVPPRVAELRLGPSPAPAAAHRTARPGRHAGHRGGRSQPRPVSRPRGLHILRRRGVRVPGPARQPAHRTRAGTRAYTTDAEATGYDRRPASRTRPDTVLPGVPDGVTHPEPAPG